MKVLWLCSFLQFYSSRILEFLARSKDSNMSLDVLLTQWGCVPNLSCQYNQILIRSAWPASIVACPNRNPSNPCVYAKYCVLSASAAAHGRHIKKSARPEHSIGSRAIHPKSVEKRNVGKKVLYWQVSIKNLALFSSLFFFFGILLV